MERKAGGGADEREEVHGAPPFLMGRRESKLNILSLPDQPPTIAPSLKKI